MSLVLALNELIVALIVVTSASLGILVYFSDKKSKINQIFSTMMILIVAWVFFGFLAGMYLQDSYSAILSARINWGAVALFSIFLYLFSVYFPRESKRNLILDGIIIIVFFAIFILSVYTDLIIKDIDIGKFGDWGNALPETDARNLALLATTMGIILAVRNLFKKYFYSPANEKNKIQYFLVGLFLFILFNVVFNIILPILGSDTKYYQFGDYSAIFIVIFTGLAIVKKELFGIKVILVDLLVSVIGLILLVFPFFLEQPLFKTISWIVFALFCVFGYLLVKATHREAKQKEILEEKVKERTKEIEKRKEDLEKFYSLTVGRELKMVELKKKIQELEEKIK